MSQKVIFKEAIRPPFWLIAFIYFMLFSLVIAVWAAFDNAAAINAFGIALVLGLVAIYLSISTIVVGSALHESGNGKTDGEGLELIIGRAHIPTKYLSKVELLSKEEFALTRTRNADPAAYLATSFWLSKGVKVTVNDPRDPTPYWLISTKRANELKVALEQSFES